MPKSGSNPRKNQNLIKSHACFGPKPKPLSERFWAKVEKQEGEDACWVWKGHTNGKYGYGMLYDRDVKDKMLAHRIAWKLEHGEYPEGILRHTCDNSSCVRTDHLRESSHRDNLIDMSQKLRAGNQFGGQKLTFEQVEEIKFKYRNDKISQEKLGRMFGVHQTVISRVLRGVNYPTKVLN